MRLSGATLFARYAYPPNELGYCGPDNASVLLERASVSAEQRIARHARRFEGAWPYLEIIAAAAGLDDPLDARVVEAYWIGNELLDLVDPQSLVAELQHRFLGQSGATWVAGSPHHSFHVLSIYPWVGLLGSEPAQDHALWVLDRCRIRSGVVMAVQGPLARVRSRPLVLDQGRLDLGAPHEELVAWSVDGRSLLPSISDGDEVAMHWNWVCDVLGSEQVGQLEARTAEQLARTNAAILCARDADAQSAPTQ